MPGSVVAEAPHRLFIAVPVPPSALDACRALLDGVRVGPAARGARWVRTENLHLTLRFLGEVAPSRVPEIADAIAAAVGGRSPFEVVLAGAGAFPSVARPRSLWIGIDSGTSGLAGLVDALEGPLAALGWPSTGGPFRPHLTVGRTDAVPVAVGSATAGALMTAARDWRISLRAERVVLYRSHMGGGPPRYAPITEVDLAG